MIYHFTDFVVLPPGKVALSTNTQCYRYNVSQNWMPEQSWHSTRSSCSPWKLPGPSPTLRETLYIKPPCVFSIGYLNVWWSNSRCWWITPYPQLLDVSLRLCPNLSLNPLVDPRSRWVGIHCMFKRTSMLHHIFGPFLAMYIYIYTMYIYIYNVYIYTQYIIIYNYIYIFSPYLYPLICQLCWLCIPVLAIEFPSWKHGGDRPPTRPTLQAKTALQHIVGVVEECLNVNCGWGWQGGCLCYVMLCVHIYIYIYIT